MTDTRTTSTTGHPLYLTQPELLALLTERFGPSHTNWAFQCPSCGDVATGADFQDALAENPIIRQDGTTVTASDIFGQHCIGRNLGALQGKAKDWKGRGCDWTAYGLFMGPVTIDLGDGKKMHCFPLANPTPDDQ